VAGPFNGNKMHRGGDLLCRQAEGVVVYGSTGTRPGVVWAKVRCVRGSAG
jgi:hypothetical protein